MATKYRVALIGCGGIARLHMTSLQSMPEVDVVGISEIRAEALESFGDAYSIPKDRRFIDFREMVERATPDIAVVATRADTHAELSTDLMRRGIHVLCEKPIAVDLREADEMIAVSEQTGMKLAVNTQRHTDPVYLHARELVRNGFIGTLRTVRSECKAYTAAVGMTNIGAHLFDATSLYGGTPRWVFASLVMNDGRPARGEDVTTGDRGTGLAIGDVGTITIGYESGLVGVSEYWEGTASYGFELVGSEGILQIRGAGPVLYHSIGGGGKANDEIVWEKLEVPLDEEQKRVYAVSRWGTHHMMRSLIRAIESDSVPACSGYDGREALEINHAAFVSALEQNRVELPLANREHPLSPWAGRIA